MMRVGLTGGIGSGKSTVAGFFRELGIPVYDSDVRARELMEADPELRGRIENLLGEEAYAEGKLNRAWIASRVFGDAKLLEALNALVHPAVAADFRSWSARQEAPYVLQEAAILIENGGYRNLDQVILVTAPEEERIRRVVARDNTSGSRVRSRMDAQWSDKRKIPLSDFVIENMELEATRRAVHRIHRELLEIPGSPRAS
ncbi:MULTISPECIES: dephospho-CoA kinase [unclassified Robiginitalea]|uniref:dephospho-CoA kinase n=1 Tax=Robiginitalea TaxID=252306 RepID=UPI00234B403E|nr:MULTISPECIES: dephospho-CoA kinase [unclassified Robiginitalea]MDC6354267.1 dephospho-CoA kinase [Robiginitalea sp. PM2]MDC6374534.1 dephospho-CoA kinase [Robiginitalea sp. SP8]